MSNIQMFGLMGAIFLSHHTSERGARIINAILMILMVIEAVTK